MSMVETKLREDALKGIKAGCVAGVVCGCVTLLVVVASNLRGDPRYEQFASLWNLVDVALIFGLSFGIYRKSRVCAVLMLIYFIISKGILLSEGVQRNATGLIVACLFIYQFWRAVRGCFYYHKHLAQPAASPQPPPPLPQ